MFMWEAAPSDIQSHSHLTKNCLRSFKQGHKRNHSARSVDSVEVSETTKQFTTFARSLAD